MTWYWWGLLGFIVSFIVSLIVGQFMKAGRGNDETDVGK